MARAQRLWRRRRETPARNERVRREIFRGRRALRATGAIPVADSRAAEGACKRAARLRERTKHIFSAKRSPKPKPKLEPKNCPTDKLSLAILRSPRCAASRRCCTFAFRARAFARKFARPIFWQPTTMADDEQATGAKRACGRSRRANHRASERAPSGQLLRKPLSS